MATPSPDTASIPARHNDRIQLAKTTGYLVAMQAAGLLDWIDECRLRNWPFVAVLRNGRRRNGRNWRLRIELDRWRFTDFGQRIMADLLAEHGADHISIGDDYAYGYSLLRWEAELIASQLMTWIRETLAEMKEAQL